MNGSSGKGLQHSNRRHYFVYSPLLFSFFLTPCIRLSWIHQLSSAHKNRLTYCIVSCTSQHSPSQRWHSQHRQHWLSVSVTHLHRRSRLSVRDIVPVPAADRSRRPGNLTVLLCTHSCLRLNNTSICCSNRLLVPSIRLSTVAGRAFPVADPSIWNNLPDTVTSAHTLSIPSASDWKPICSLSPSLTLYWTDRASSSTVVPEVIYITWTTLKFLIDWYAVVSLTVYASLQCVETHAKMTVSMEMPL